MTKLHTIKPEPDVGELAKRLQRAKTEFDHCEAKYLGAQNTLVGASTAFDQAVADLRQRTGNGQAGPVEIPLAPEFAALSAGAVLQNEGRYVGAEWTASDWLDAGETEIPGDLMAQLGKALTETGAENRIKLGPAVYSRMTPGVDSDCPGPPKDMGDVILVVATAKVEEVLEA